MKERLQQLLEMEQLNSSRFADLIGVQRSSVSHVLSGRNNPSYDFLQKTLHTFPGLRADWLLLGKGTMYEQMGRPAEPDLFASAVRSGSEGFPVSATGEKATGSSSEAEVDDPSRSGGDPLPSEPAVSSDPLSSARTEREVVQVVVIYSDHTFRAYRPSE